MFCSLTNWLRAFKFCMQHCCMVVYQNISNCNLAIIVSPMLWVPRFYKDTKTEIFKTLLLPNCMALSFQILYAVLLNGSLPKYFKPLPLDHWMPYVVGYDILH